MYYETMPLYPALRPGCESQGCLRVPVFGEREGPCCGQLPPLSGVRRVTIENPCRPGECAEVLLGLDGCGNLVVCVRKEPERPCCPERPPRPRCDRHRGRLYGTW